MLMMASLLDPAYDEIGPASCVGLTGGWTGYSWPPAIAMTSALMTFLMEFAAERYVEKKYAIPHNVNEDPTSENFGRSGSVDAAMMRYEISRQHSAHHSHQAMHSADQDGTTPVQTASIEPKDNSAGEAGDHDSIDAQKEKAIDFAFKQQIAAFLILEFGVLFHSVISK